MIQRVRAPWRAGGLTPAPSCGAVDSSAWSTGWPAAAARPGPTWPGSPWVPAGEEQQEGSCWGGTMSSHCLMADTDLLDFWQMMSLCSTSPVSKSLCSFSTGLTKGVPLKSVLSWNSGESPIVLGFVRHPSCFHIKRWTKHVSSSNMFLLHLQQPLD